MNILTKPNDFILKKRKNDPFYQTKKFLIDESINELKICKTKSKVEIKFEMIDEP